MATPSGNRDSIKSYVRTWIRLEKKRYADKKWGKDEGNRQLKLDGMREPGQAFWWGYVENYLRRAELLDLSTLAGRQALGKAVITINAMLEMAVEVWGPMPEPGVPSGEIKEWDWPLITDDSVAWVPAPAQVPGQLQLPDPPDPPD